MFDVKKQLMWSKLKAGTIVTAAFLLVLLAVFFAGSLEDIMVPKAEIKAQIKDVKGLRKGAPVWLSGVEIGVVKDMSLHPEYGTLVAMSVKKDAMKLIRKDSQATILTMGLLGDKYIELSTGTAGAGHLMPGDIIEGRAQLEVKDLIDASSESLSKVTDFVDKLGSFLEKIEKSEGTAGRLLTDPALYNNLKDTSANLAAILKDFRKSEGTMKRLVDDPELYKKMLAAASSVEEFSRKLNEGQGTLKKLADDRSLYDNLDNASQRLSSILSKIDSGKGLAGSIVGDRELEIELKETVAELKETMEEFRDLTKDIKGNPEKYFKFSLF